MYDRPASRSVTFFASISKPVTLKPASERSRESGNPTYPSPITPIFAVRVSRRFMRSCAIFGRTTWCVVDIVLIIAFALVSSVCTKVALTLIHYLVKLTSGSSLSSALAFALRFPIIGRTLRTTHLANAPATHSGGRTDGPLPHHRNRWFYWLLAGPCSRRTGTRSQWHRQSLDWNRRQPGRYSPRNLLSRNGP